MIVKKLLDEIKSQSSEFEVDMEKLRSMVVEDDILVYDEFYAMIKKYQLHPRIIDLLADQMQLEKNESLSSQYSLDEVEILQEINLRINPSDVVVLASHLHHQYLTNDADQLEMHRIDDLIKELEELRDYLNE